MSIAAFYGTFSYIFEMAVAVGLFAITLKKRKFWWQKFIIVTGVGALLKYFFSIIFSDRMIWIFTEYLMVIIVLCIVLWISCDITIKDAIYGTLCAYAMQHLASSLFIIIGSCFPDDIFWQYWNNAHIFLVCIFIYACVYSCSYYFLIKNLHDNGKYNVKFLQSTEVIMLVIPFALVISMIEKLYGQSGTIDFIICQIYAITCAFFVLWLQHWQRKTIRLQTEMIVQSHIMKARQEQYEQSLSNIDIINQKCHDLKYQLQALRNSENDKIQRENIEELEQAVQIYDTTLQTGNEVLDMVLMEKSLLCNKWGIQMTCLADGARMEFMKPIDLYTIFGNAIDNAIEAVTQIEEEEKRIIAVSLFPKKDITILQIENYFENELISVHGLPMTSKNDTNYHGFGLKSIKMTVEKYGGCMTLNTEDHIFILTIVFPNTSNANYV